MDASCPTLVCRADERISAASFLPLESFGTRCANRKRVIVRLLELWLATATLSASIVAAQVSAPARPAFSIGQPPLWDFDASVVAPVHTGETSSWPWLSGSVHHAIINPVTGLLGVTGEGYLAVNGRSGGARLFAESKALAVSAGVDWSASLRRLSPIISYETAVRRGGLFGHGSMLRIDWLPTRSQTIAIGASVPLNRPLAGRTRPRRTHVRLAASGASMPPVARPAAITPADVDRLRAAASVVGAFSNAYSVRAATLIRNARDGYAAAIADYDSLIEHLFVGSAGDSAVARRAEARGRANLLDRVLIPLDSLFGQAKENPTDIRPLTGAALASFSRWCNDSTRVTPNERVRLEAAFSTWLDAVADVYREMLTDANDSRLAWAPLALALHADQFDEQSEVDSLIARTVGHPFSDQNALTYLRSSDLPLEIARSIDATRTYHVLWTHDFAGRRETGAIDNVAYSMVADAYLPALTAAVKRYDSTGVFPTYIILQDEFFYEPRDNRLWMDILQDPLHASIRLKGDTTPQREAHLLARQAELRAAVRASTRLQRDAAASGNPEHWIRKTVSVHVNIVEPYDFSFRSSHSIPPIPFTPDNIMRDHRKLVFYDLTEARPYDGALLLMGVGIGEHYASATWEDRGYRVRGPAALEARRAVREALRRNGFSEQDIPVPLREVASVKGVETEMNDGDYVGRALQVNNEVGFGRKESSVARAMLYELAPPGSVIIVPDPMWQSDTWAGMLAGAAARGCRVYIVAPAEANAPSPQAPLMAVQHDVLTRMLHLRDSLASQIRSSGGDLRVGMFAAHANVDDAAGRAREVREGLARTPWILDVIPFDSSTLAILQGAERTVATQPNATELAHDPKPRELQLHQKAQLIARPGAIANLVRQPGWDVVLAQAIRVQARQTAQFAEQLGYSTPNLDTSATRRTDALLTGYERSLSPSERRRVSFYFSVGSQNQDPRGIVSDGETTLIVSGVSASAGLVDLFFLMARSNWITTEAELDTYNRPRSGFVSRIAWLVRAAF